jgi:hypothetical protein
MHRRICSLLLILVLVCAAALPVRAHEVPDTARLGSIAISMTHQGEPIPGGSLTLYRAADVVSSDGDYLFAYTADFAECTIPVTELASADLPRALADIARDKNMEGITLALDDGGKVKFSELELGLYLLIQQEAAPGFKKVNPFLVSVPQNVDGHYIYDVDTAPKNLPGPDEETTPPPPPPPPTGPDGPDLPQTGQLNWPVPVLAVLGMLLVAAGFALCNAEKRKER